MITLSTNTIYNFYRYLGARLKGHKKQNDKAWQPVVLEIGGEKSFHSNLIAHILTNIHQKYLTKS